MCVICADALQQRMDDAALLPEPEQLIVHIDDFADVVHGEPIDQTKVENEFHNSGADCWCDPLIIPPSETRNAYELIDNWYQHLSDRDASAKIQ